MQFLTFTFPLLFVSALAMPAIPTTPEGIAEAVAELPPPTGLEAEILAVFNDPNADLDGLYSSVSENIVFLDDNSNSPSRSQLITNVLDYKCETSQASPTLTEIEGLWRILWNRNGGCSNTYLGGNGCTHIGQFKGAGANLCGRRFTVECKKAANAVHHIRKHCATNYQKAGGQFYFGDRTRLDLF